MDDHQAPRADSRQALLRASLEWLVAYNRVAFIAPNRRHELLNLIESIKQEIAP